MQEIERKFFVTKLPKLEGKPISYERHFLEITPTFQKRIQHKGEKYELETKKIQSSLNSTKEKKKLTKQEFETLKEQAIASLKRESYILSDGATIKVYKGKYKGLIRLEVEFSSESKAKKYVPPKWAKQEITNSPLGKDATLVMLEPEEFKKIIKEY